MLPECRHPTRRRHAVPGGAQRRALVFEPFRTCPRRRTNDRGVLNNVPYKPIPPCASHRPSRPPYAPSSDAPSREYLRVLDGAAHPNPKVRHACCGRAGRGGAGGGAIIGGAQNVRRSHRSAPTSGTPSARWSEVVSEQVSALRTRNDLQHTWYDQTRVPREYTREYSTVPYRTNLNSSLSQSAVQWPLRRMRCPRVPQSTP